MVSHHVVLGAQWGDEGKGKVVDVLTENKHAVVRFNGGANAGHTIYVAGEKKVLHLLPVGIVRKGTENIVGPAVVCDPEMLVEELRIAASSGARVLLDRRAPLVLPIHKLIDGAREATSGSSAIGTTKRGIGPCYEDWVSRRGVTLGDLEGTHRLREALGKSRFYEERASVARLHGAEPMSLDATVAWAMEIAPSILPHLGDAVERVHALDAKGSSILFEGAQGIMLDVIHGSRPHCTSSSCGLGGVIASFGSLAFDRVEGVAKAYATRVGGGPFPTELSGPVGDRIREKGGEYGATTGRPRRCGWLDLVALKYACRVGGVKSLVLTKLDVLTGFDDIDFAIRYRVDGKLIDGFGFESLTGDVLDRAEPFYDTITGWHEPLADCREFRALPSNAQQYVTYIEKYLSVHVSGISVGPERDQIIWR